MKKIFLLMLVLVSTHIFAVNDKVALVIGNSAYKNSPLKNPINDAQDMSNKLKKLGFEVVVRTNLSTKQIGPTLREFRSKLSPGAVAVVFYAGHGVQIKGENYFPTIDAEITSEEDVPNQSLSVKQIMDILEESKARLNLVFLDACRNNPYARNFRSTSTGLARLNAPSGTMISYATRPGSVAADGDSRNGLYTEYLLKAMDLSDPIELALKTVVTGVKKASRGSQEPWMEGSIEGNFSFVDSNLASNIGREVITPVLSNSQLEDKFWDDVKFAGNKEAFDAYLKRYPSGQYANLAIANIKKLDQVANASIPSINSLIIPTPPIQAIVPGDRRPDSMRLDGLPLVTAPLNNKLLVGNISKVFYQYNYAEVVLLPGSNVKAGDFLSDGNTKVFLVEKIKGDLCSLVPFKDSTFSGIVPGNQLFRNMVD